MVRVIATFLQIWSDLLHRTMLISVGSRLIFALYC